LAAGHEWRFVEIEFDRLVHFHLEPGDRAQPMRPSLQPQAGASLEIAMKAANACHYVTIGLLPCRPRM
jgi:hypothetical protein